MRLVLIFYTIDLNWEMKYKETYVKKQFNLANTPLTTSQTSSLTKDVKIHENPLCLGFHQPFP